MAKFEVPEVNYSVLAEKVAKLNKKADKLGTSPIKFELTGSHFEEWTNPDGGKVPVKIMEIEVVGEAPVLNGWKMAAKLEHTEAGNVLYSLIEEDLPERFRTVEPNCEHCNTLRYRKDTYVVVNEAGEFKQVGSSCLKDFTGHANPEALAKWAEYILALYDDCAESCWDPDRFVGGSNYLELSAFLDNVAAVVREYGWVSRGAVYRGETEKVPSADLAISNMKAPWYASWRVEVTEADSKLTEKAIGWVREEVSNRDDLNDYFWNLTISFSDDYITFKQAGIAASAIVAYKKEQERKAEADKAPSDYVGTIKKRLEFDSLRLVFSTSFSGYYGVTYLYKFVDEAGNVLVWKTNSYFDWADGETVVSGKATVKDHSEYRGVKQTVLTRCNFEEVA